MKLLSSNKYPLKDHSHQCRFWHLATVIDGSREYLAFWDSLEDKVYVERFQGFTLIEISDQEYRQVEPFMREKGIFQMPLVSPEIFNAYYRQAHG
jgi:hypothetical protein